MAERTTAPNISAILREAYEDGTITWNDMQQSLDFASGLVQMKRITYGMGAATVVGMVGFRRYRGHPIGLFRFMVVWPVAFGVGCLPGIISQAYAYQKFLGRLDNPSSLIEVIKKHRGADPWSSSIEEVRSDSSAPPVPTPEPTGSTRWDELRKGSGAVGASTWDRIRENQEKARVNATAGDHIPDGPLHEARMRELERKAEQERFDDLLEAERKMAER